MGAKHFFAGVCATVIAAGCLGNCGVAFADDTEDGIVIDTSQDSEYGDLTYRIDADHIIITSCDTMTSNDIEIPAEIDGLPVTEIGDAAFISCNFITQVTIPEGVTKIGESAFASMSMLTQIDLPKSLEEIGAGAFESDTSLWNITLPDTLTEIPTALFYECSLLSDIKIPAACTEIGAEAFYSCTGIAEISLPNGIASIGDYAFQDCQSLARIEIPAACTSIGKYVFDGCQSLTEISVQAGNSAYRDIDGVLFNAGGDTLIRYPQAKSDSDYVVPDACTTLDDWSFIGTLWLVSIDLNNVQTIGEDCFYYCTSLETVEIPEGVTILDGSVFAYCLALENITLPSTLTELGFACFLACTSLREITVPEGVTTLGDLCFYNCASLELLSLPASITEIGDEAIGYYDDEDGNTARMDALTVENAGSDAVTSYLNHWHSGNTWIIFPVIGIVVVVAAGIVILVPVSRSRRKIRPAKK